jgi:hypothetical protein
LKGFVGQACPFGLLDKSKTTKKTIDPQEGKMLSRLDCHCEVCTKVVHAEESIWTTKQSVYFNTKPIFILFLFFLLSFTPFNNLYSQTVQPNPDSIPFAPAVNYSVGNGPQSVFCADLDGDGDLDLAVSNYYSNNVCILKNNGDGTFYLDSCYVLVDGFYSVYSVFGTDLDGDGDVDLAVANVESDSVSILINLSSRPYSYSLLFPLNNDSVKTPVTFTWQTSIDPDPDDTVHYDLYLSRSIVFNLDSTIVYDNLLDTTFTDSLDLKLWYWKVKAYDKWGAVRWSDQTWSFYVYICGDCNGDGLINVADVVYEINYLFKGGPVMKPLVAGEVNCDGSVTVSDVVYTINYLFKGGSKPCQECP